MNITPDMLDRTATVTLEGDETPREGVKIAAGAAPGSYKLLTGKAGRPPVFVPDELQAFTFTDA